MKVDEMIFREPPVRLYYRKNKDHRRSVSRYRRLDTDEVYLNWAELLRRFDGLKLEPNVYWTIRKMITEMV